ncbi:MAG: AMP-binding protein [Planctomycetota bacterium]
MLDSETARLGPDLVPWLRAERVTVLCPPPTLLRAMDCEDPARELPLLRLCYAGGEAMPQDLADRWGKALWLENGYGPTECTVTVVRGRLMPKQPVTIGTPVPGHTALLLDDQLQPVPEGEPGELCIAGTGLARGYLGQAELTAQRFPTVPGFGRIYRTGDLAQRGDDGQLYCLGRIDAQVKLRGHRIELEAIEAALAACDGVREAACRVQNEAGADSLCAFLVPDDPALPPTAAALEAALRGSLPVHMVPARFTVLPALPKSVGGKLDRKALPNVPARDAAPERRAQHRGRAPRGQLEETIAAAFSACLGAGVDVAADDDFFALGGDSLRAAQMISRLRRIALTATLAVRDVYAARTVAALASVAEQLRLHAAPASAATAAVVRPVEHALLVTAAQTAWLLLLLLAGSATAWLLAFELLPWLLRDFGLVACLLLSPLLGAAMLVLHTAVSLWFAVLAKQLLIGRYTAGRIPVWGSFHLRHWLVVHIVRLVPWGLLEGTVFQCAALRLLGARIGARVHIHRDVDLRQGGWDLLDIGDDAMIGREAHLGLVELDAGHLCVGPVRLGARATLETRAGMGPDSSLGCDAMLTALSFLSSGRHVPAGERWHGVPAQAAGRNAPTPEVGVEGRTLSPIAHGLLLVLSRLALGPAIAAPFVALCLGLIAVAAFDTATCIAWLYGEGPRSHPLWIAAAAGLAVTALIASLFAPALLLRWSKAVPAGTHSRWSSTHLRLSLRTGMLESAGEWLSGTLFWPAWLRLAGMRIGPGCEVSTILDVLPEHTTIGAWSFLADGVYLGVPRLQAGTVTVAPTSLGANTFLGNHVVVPTGERLPDDLLLGVSTVADARQMARGTAWFGQPPFALPRREVVTAERRLTHEPGAVRYGNRVFWESLRFLLPALPVVLALLWFDVVGRASGTSPLWQLLVVVPAATLAVGAVLAFVILALKWLLLGRVRPGQHGLWSCWASRWDFHYVVWNRYGRALLTQLEGTLLLPWYLRAMGMRIGKRVVLGDGFAQVVDPDMIRLDDGVTVHAMFQAHSFEDRVLKIDRVRLGAHSTVGRGSVVLYGADIGEGAHVSPHSVVMKHEHLLAGQHYAGVPTAPVAAVAPAVPTVAPPQAPATTHRERDHALDVARGIAVIGMILVHFVPDDGIAVLTAMHGKPAALFVLLAGMAWAIQAGHRPDRSTLWRYTARRALTLAVTGWLFWHFVWPTEVLLPFALMLPLVVWLVRRGTGALLCSASLLLLAAPLATALFGTYVAIDCLEDGTHLANSSFGWHTLRYFAFDGSYPLLPWLVLPLLGALLVARDDGSSANARRWFWLALPLASALGFWNIWSAQLDEQTPELAPFLTATWQPTSLPFLLQIGAVAVSITAALQWWHRARGLPRVMQPIARIGRASLTHYVLHIVLVYAPMRHWWPAEDWSFATGVLAVLTYLAMAVPLTWWWFTRFRQGPLEALWARASS